MNIEVSTVFKDLDKSESGYLVWNGGTIFVIKDKNFNEVDIFTINSCKNLEDAHKIANEHFEKVGKNLEDCEGFGIGV